MGKVYVFDHPLIQHKTAMIRDKNTGTKDFRQLVGEIAMLMTYESSRDLPLEDVTIETPICETTAKMLKGQDVAIVPILRAGLGMVDGILQIIPNAKVGHVGLYRDPETHEPHEYYCKMPFVKQRGGKDIIFMCLIAAPEGIEVLQKAHPDVDIYIAAKDECLNENAYIVPGLGDAGDRIFGTK